MAAKFDNLDDVQSKFAGTVCLYDGKAVYVKHGEQDAEINGGFVLYVQSPGGKGKYVKLIDPLFSYKDFNIGYANMGQYASWWYRKPQKQYRQGLKQEQMGWKTSTPGAAPEDYFQFNKIFNAMLENNYPTIDQCQAILKTQHASVIAFHRDFALSWDNIHNDFILEYRANRIGTVIGNNVKNFKLLPEFQHLTEALKEALP